MEDNSIGTTATSLTSSPLFTSLAKTSILSYTPPPKLMSLSSTAELEQTTSYWSRESWNVNRTALCCSGMWMLPQRSGVSVRIRQMPSRVRSRGTTLYSRMEVGRVIEEEYRQLGARSYYSIYNGLDPDTHHPVPPNSRFNCDVCFVGNRLPDREARVEQLFLRAAELAPTKQFILGGEGWGDKSLPANVQWIGHVPTADHNSVNSSAGMVMNINRSSMADCGFSPPTRVFEAAGAGACLLCDDWPGIDECFEPGKEILVIRSAEDVVDATSRLDSAARRKIGDAFLRRALRDHTYAARAKEIEDALIQCIGRKSASPFAESVRVDMAEEPA